VCDPKYADDPRVGERLVALMERRVVVVHAGAVEGVWGDRCVRALPMSTHEERVVAMRRHRSGKRPNGQNGIVDPLTSRKVKPLKVGAANWNVWTDS
jgi:hypothetical protein